MLTAFIPQLTGFPALPRFRAVYAGLGFGLGFGWLWFPALQEYWIPEVLWGSPFQGGGFFFLAALFTGFMLYGLLAGRFPKSWFRFTPPGDAVHGAGLILLATALLPAWPASGPAAYPPALCLAGLALVQGLYWGGTLLALPARESGAAFLAAALAQLGLSLLDQIAAGNWRRAIMLLSLAAAWIAARRLVLLTRKLMETPRPRGRPAKEQNPAPARPADFTSLRGLYGKKGAGAFALLLAGAALLPPPASAPLPGIALLSACGALAGFLICRFSPSTRLLSPAPALLGLVLVFFPGLGWSWMAAPFAEGLFCLPALTLIPRSDSPANPASPALPARRAALLLAGALALSFPAYALPVSGTSALVIGLASLLLAGTLALSPLRPPDPAGDKAIKDISATGPEPKEHGSSLTRRELEILDCLEQGMRDAQIAARLGIREATARYHLANMFKKTGCRTRARLASIRREKTAQFARPQAGHPISSDPA